MISYEHVLNMYLVCGLCCYYGYWPGTGKILKLLMCGFYNQYSIRICHNVISEIVEPVKTERLLKVIHLQ